jgi:hypothetical protein
MIRLILSAAALTLCVGAAQAACTISKGPFRPAFGENAAKTLKTDMACRIGYAPFDDEALTAVSVTREPQHGALRRTGRLEFVYTPAPGYAGPDVFALQVCAEQLGRSGCSVVTYQSTIRR